MQCNFHVRTEVVGINQKKGVFSFFFFYSKTHVTCHDDRKGKLEGEN